MKGPVLLRGRLALITACVVAVAIAGISVVTWLTTSHNLRAQLDQSLLANLPPGAMLPRPPGAPPREFKLFCPAGRTGEELQPFLLGIQLFKFDGSTCAPPGVDPVITRADDFVRETTFRDGETVSGTSVRALLQPMANGDVLVLSRSFADYDNAMTNLANVLMGVSVLGALLAAAAGLVLTRRTLAPMERLTETAEHIARTEDLTTPVTVSGQDEVGRLGRAFTSMTAALAEFKNQD